MLSIQKNHLSESLSNITARKKVSFLLEEAKKLVNNDTVKGIVYLQEALPLIKKFELFEFAYPCYMQLGINYYFQQDFQQSITYFQQAYKIAVEKKDKKLMGNSGNNLGAIYMQLFNWHKALDYFIKALENNNPSLNASIYCNIGIIHLELKKYDQASYYFQQAISTAQITQNTYVWIASLIGVSEVYIIQKNYTQALHVLHEALDLQKKESTPNHHTSCLTNLGRIYHSQKKYAHAIKYYEQAISKAKRIDNIRLLKYGLKYLGKLYIDLKDYQLATYLLKESIKDCDDFWIEHKIAVYKELEVCAVNMDDIPLAYQYIKEQNIQLEKKNEKQAIDVSNLLDKNERITNLQNLNDQIAKQNKELEKTNQELRDYTHIIAHDLKEPLRNINGFIHLFSRYNEVPLSVESLEYMDYILKNTLHMKQLLEDLLIYSSIEKKTNIPKTNINIVIKHLLENELKASIQEEVQIQFHALPILPIHPKHANQLFSNLLHNAIKFRKIDTPCHIHIQYSQTSHFHQFSIKDNGIGIEKDYLKQIFKIFKRLDRDNYEGTGIGLAICTKIVGLYDGQIWIESEYGVGSTFFFTIAK